MAPAKVERRRTALLEHLVELVPHRWQAIGGNSVHPRREGYLFCGMHVRRAEMKIAEEAAENPSDELTQIECDKKMALLSGQPLVEAVLEIKKRGASHQNIADEIDEMTKGNKPRFGGSQP
jgi:hypothetical protein